MLRPRSERASVPGVERGSIEEDRGSLAPIEGEEDRLSEAPLEAGSLPPVAGDAFVAGDPVAAEPEPIAAATVVELIVPAPPEAHRAEVKSEASALVEAVLVESVLVEAVSVEAVSVETSVAEKTIAVSAIVEEIVPGPVEATPIIDETPAPAAAFDQRVEVSSIQEKPAAEPIEAQADAPAKKKKKKDKKGDAAKTSKKEKQAEVASRTSERSELEPLEASPAAKTEAARTETAKVEDAHADQGRAASATPLGFAHDDDLSISNHHFFSQPPPPMEAAPITEEEPRFVAPSKEVLERRTRNKKVVGAVLAAAALFAVIAVGKMVLGSKSADALPSSGPTNKPAPAKVEEAKGKPLQPQPTATVEAAPTVAETASAATPADSAAPADSASAAPSTSASADVPPGDAKSPEDVKKLQQKCAGLANGGNMKKAVEACNEAVAGGANDAMTFMYLYNSYSMLGKGNEAHEALNECMRKVTTPDKFQCAQWGGKP